ncbi:hypothetical protein VNI00_015748 [Paramarasmius palmivorus]|uniref:Uncharacterized protein n=1 Tax=Paramarasmius palmivorus TaxID=297713 RepID=A0AAW0BIB5_9AGAR
MSTQVQVVPIEWHKDHHRAIEVPRDGGSETYHVFAIAGPPVFGDVKGRYNIDIEIPIGPIILELKGYIDLGNLDADIYAYIKVPIFGTYQVGELKGNLKTGISISVGIPGILSGTITLYAKDGWLWIKFSLTIFGKTYTAEFKLIPIPPI